MTITVYIILIIILIFLSAFFSGSETAIISSNRHILEYQAEKKRFGAKQSIRILDNLDETLSMILIGNNIANLSATVFIVYIAKNAFYLKESKFIIVTIVQTLFFLIFCEIYPKVISRFKPESTLKAISYPLTFFLWIFKPMSSISLLISNFFKSFFKFSQSGVSTVQAREELNALFKMGEKSGILEETENNYIKEILSLHQITANEVMTPTIDIASVEINDNVKNIVSLIEKTKFSRIAVFEERVDNIIGYVYFRDILTKKPKAIKDILHDAIYAPSTKKIYTLYREMLNNKKHIVFIINEYGAVEGLVTREDIAEEIVGEIQTTDHFKEDLYEDIGQNRFLVTGYLDIDYFDMVFKIGIRKEGFETVSGFLLFLLGYIPKKGEKVNYKDVVFTIEEATIKTIDKVIVKLPKSKNITLR